MKIIALLMLFISGFMFGTFIVCLLVSLSAMDGLLALGGLAMAVIATGFALRFNELVNA